MYMNVLSVFFCMGSMYDVITSLSCNKRGESIRFRVKPANLVIDRDVFQNSENENTKNKPNGEANDYLNPISEYAQFFQRKRNKHLSDGIDHRWQNITTARSRETETFDEINTYVENQRKLAMLRTLENTHVSEISKLRLIQSWPELFPTKKEALYAGFEEFMGENNTLKGK